MAPLSTTAAVTCTCRLPHCGHGGDGAWTAPLRGVGKFPRGIPRAAESAYGNEPGSPPSQFPVFQWAIGHWMSACQYPSILFVVCMCVQCSLSRPDRRLQSTPKGIHAAAGTRTPRRATLRHTTPHHTTPRHTMQRNATQCNIWQVIIRESLPLSGAGKILKNELRKEFNTDALGNLKSKL